MNDNNFIMKCDESFFKELDYIVNTDVRISNRSQAVRLAIYEYGKNLRQEEQMGIDLAKENK